MTSKRIKPILAVTVDQEVADWVKQEAESRHLKTAQFVNQILHEAKQAEEGGVGVDVAALDAALKSGDAAIRRGKKTLAALKKRDAATKEKVHID